MLQSRVAKLFKNGASQAVRLPADFRFDGEEVYIRREEATGNVVLSGRPGADAWDRFFALVESSEIPEDFMAERPMNQLSSEEDVFGADEP